MSCLASQWNPAPIALKADYGSRHRGFVAEFDDSSATPHEDLHPATPQDGLFPAVALELPPLDSPCLEIP